MGKKIQCLGRYVMDCHTLGKGNFARVELATHSVTGCKVAIKIIETRKIKEEYCRQNLHREARILAQLRHPNIIRLYETLKANTLYCLVLEGALGGDLQAYIKSFKQLHLPEDKARVFLRQLVSAIHYLHERGVAHRDLKMENIMLDEKKKNIKIVDFGLSNTFNKGDMMKTRCGSLEYAAPELFSELSDKYGPEVDVWSIGVVTYAMVVGKLPFTTPYTDQFRRQKLLQQIEKGLCETQQKEMCHLSEDCKQLLTKLLEPNASLRLPIIDVEIHPWVTCDAKMPFFPFHAFPRDKLLKSQVIDEVTEMMGLNREQVEKTVQESKCDDLSAMFNMMMDNKRKEKGVFDLDYTSFHERRREKRESKGTKHKKKLAQKSENMVTQDVEPYEAATSGEKTGHEEEAASVMTEAERLQAAHDHKVSTNFDFMALCSAPTWLEGKKRRSRRRRNALHSPLPSSEADSGSVQQSPDVLGVQQGAPENPNLLSPSQAQLPYNRRSLRRRSSRRRSGARSSSYGPGSRRTFSMKETHTSSSQPNSPTLLINPEIKIDPPNNLHQIPKSGRHAVNECKTPSVTLLVPNNQTEDYSYGESDQNFSEISCSNSPDLSWSQEIIPVQCNRTRTSTAEIHSSQSKHLKHNHQESVEAIIAATDIKSLVKPKDRKLKLMNSESMEATAVPVTELDHHHSSGSCDEPSTMQASDDKNVWDCEASGGCEETSVVEDFHVDVGGVCLSDVECADDQVDSRTDLLEIVNPHSVVKDINHPLKGRRINSKDQICTTTLVDLKSKICTPQKLDLKLPIVKNLPESSSVHAKDIANVSNKDVNSQDCVSSNPNLPEDKISPLTPVDGYCKHLYKFSMPNTPTRNMFKTPLARIESFHSDDFDTLLADVSMKSTATTPSSAVQTPTLPCFAYKLNLKKKNAKLKSCKSAKTASLTATQECTSVSKETTDSHENQNDPSTPLIAPSSSGDQSTAKQDDSTEKNCTVSKAKIHPMDREEQDTELLIKGSKISKANPKNQCLLNTETTGNDIRSKNSQNCSKHNSENKKSSHKCSPWKHGFVQFLRKKRPHSHPHRSHNNNDSVHSNHHVMSATTRNGHARISCNNFLKTSQEDSSCEIETQFMPSPNPVLTDSLEVRASPVPGHSSSPSTTKVFDFTVVTASESPQPKSCLLSWKGCRDCTYSDDQLSEDGGSECTFRFEQSVDVAIKTSMAIKNVQDAKNYSAYKYAHT